ncbi:MAG: DUF305 domain-containing protein [Leptolyngbyaceae bacterium]|nr:DUF305 domain-containing protein [Leptolyngbyaceae bacterium]
MQRSTKLIAAIAGLCIATAGTVTLSYFASSSNANADPAQQPDQSDWQMPMHRGQMPMHRGQMPIHHGSYGQNDSVSQGQWQEHHNQMMSMMQVNSEFDFLSQMIPHHEEAIATAERVLAKSDRPEMREFAQSIIDVQSAEIDQMKTWLDQWYPAQPTDLSYMPMMRDLSQLEGNELDQVFLEDMVMHHMGAVMMSQHLVNHGLVEHQPIEAFAQNIADTQRQEIWQMQTWLQDWYGVSAMPGPMHGMR